MRRHFATAPITFAVLVTTTICAILLVTPASTVTTKYFNDLLVFLDGGYRVALGQVPNHDFHTALGPLAFYVPGFGYWLSERLGMAMPLGMTALIALVAPIMIHVLQTRMRPLIAIPTGILLLLVLAAPHNTGEVITNISFAMFYNRIGWALLGLLLIMYLAPIRPMRGQIALDTLGAVVLTLFLLYTKISYGLVAVAFLFLVLLQPVQRRWAALSLLAVVACISVIELIWSGTRAHVNDLIVAASVSGSKTIVSYINVLLDNLTEYAPFCLIAGLALWRTRSVSDFLFYMFCAGAGLALVIQNFQNHGIITLLIGVAVAAEQLARGWPHHLPRPFDIAVRGGWLVAVVLMLPVGLASGAALGLHAAMAMSGAGTSLDLPNARGLRIAETINPWDYKLYRSYADSLEAGASLLQSLDDPVKKVLVIDFASPFTSLMGLEAPESGTAWMHDGRNFNADFHFPPDEFLHGVEVVMIPKKPIAGSTTDLMLEIYDDHFEQYFEQIRDTQEWVVLRRTDDTTGPHQPRPRLSSAASFFAPCAQTDADQTRFSFNFNALRFIVHCR